MTIPRRPTRSHAPRPAPRPTPRPARLAGLAVSPLLLLAACQGGGEDADPGPDPAPVAEALAAGLASGDLADVPVVGERPAAAQRTYDDVVAGMDGLEPAVSVEDVVVEEGGADGAGGAGGATAEVTLAWEWPVADEEPWRYTSTAPLVLDGTTWRAEVTPAVVEPSLSGAASLDLEALPARRGEIRGAGGTPLVTDRQVLRVGIDKTQVPRAGAVVSAEALARLVDVDVAPYVEAVREAGDAAFVEAIVLRVEDAGQALTEGAAGIDGARLLPDTLPLAPTREFAAPLLGSVGPVTAEMVEEDPERYAAGDVAGLSGLQARYDDQLRGVDGVRVTRVGAGGQRRALVTVRPVAGTALRLTLDQALQLEAERLLADVGPASALVAVRPSDGALLVAAQGPGADGLDIATFGQYPPGSTFKVVSTLALLRAGLRPDSTVPCTASVVVDGKRFENYDDYPADRLGDVPLSTAVASSCNTAFIAERDRPGQDGLAEAAASLGLGVDHEVGFPAYFGQVEPPATETERAADMIGQGTVLASPLTMASVVASVQDGRTVLPRLVEGEAAPAPVEQDGPPLARDEAAQLRTLLRGVVTGGSGALLADVPGPPVIAKTGTAEFGTQSPPQTHAWMVAAQGDLAVAVFVEEGDSGSGVAGPILESFLRVAAQ